MKKLKKLAVCCLSVLLLSGSLGLYSSFAVSAAEAGTNASDAKAVPETVRWFNGTYAILTYVNGADLSLPGGGEPDSFYALCISLVLQRDWGIQDRAGAEKMIEWLETEGHNQSLLNTYAELNLGQYASDIELAAASEAQNLSVGEQVRRMAAYEAVGRYGEHAAAAWDLSRALMLLGDYYVTGYYTYEEAMDKSLEIAGKLQGMYDSWDDFAQSYMYGYAYWSKSDPTEPDSQFQYRSSVYYYLKGLENGPYEPDWKMELKKEW